MGRRFVIIALVIALLILPASPLLNKPVEAKKYDENMNPKQFEDLFFPIHFRGMNYEFNIPKKLRNESFGNFILWDKEYRGFAVNESKEEPYDLPEDYKNANITIRNRTGDIIYTADNKFTSVGGGSRNSIRFNNTSKISITTRGEFTFYLFIEKNWNDFVKYDQRVNFNGTTRTYNLWGLTHNFYYRQDKKYVELHIESNKPIKAYVFEGTEGEIVDCNLTKTKEKRLKILDRENPMSVGDITSLTVSTFEDQAENVTFTFNIELKDIPTGTPWILYISLVVVIVSTAVVVTWFKMKERS